MARVYGVTAAGNFEGTNILHLPVGFDELADATGLTVGDIEEQRSRFDAALLDHRQARIRPGRDDKVITAWNGLAIRAFAEAGAVLGSDRYLNAARRIARFCLTGLTNADGRLLRSARNGRGSVPGFCEDYGALVVGLLTLYQATGETEWFDAGQRLTGDMIDLFADPHEPGFFATGKDAEDLISRPKNFMDNPTPSDNSLAAEALQMLLALSGNETLREHLDGIHMAAGALMEQHPAAVGHLLAVFAVDRPKEVAVLGSRRHRQPLVDVVWETFRPDVVLAPGDGATASIPLLTDRSAGANGSRAYVCRDFVCALPVDTPEELREQLEDGRQQVGSSR
jgi:uncharacterized protein YyaL (SSP411 family)